MAASDVSSDARSATPASTDTVLATAAASNLRRKALALVVAIVLATACAALLLLLAPPLAGPGLLALTFGLRHGVDADHIAAIDNATRRLTTERTRPVTVGFFFAMGHSLVVTLLCGLVAATTDLVRKHMGEMAEVGGIVGASISGSFLIIVGTANMWSARRLWQEWRQQREPGEHSHAMVGVFIRCCPRLFEGIRRPWHMLPVGFLFGLGFDTSSEVGLLALVAISQDDVPRAAIMLLPALFMGGMCLVDTLNGMLMAWAYGRSQTDIRQRIYYNLFLTGTSGTIALVIGIVEIFGVIGEGNALEGGFWEAVAAINESFEILGFVMVGFFAMSMLVAFVYYRKAFPRNAARSSEAPDAKDNPEVQDHLMRYIRASEYIDRSGV